jgi:hypothetical protein
MRCYALRTTDFKVADAQKEQMPKYNIGRGWVLLLYINIKASYPQEHKNQVG